MLSVTLCDHISNIAFNKYYYSKLTGYCNYSVHVFTFGQAQSDHIKRLLLYHHFVLLLYNSSIVNISDQDNYLNSDEGMTSTGSEEFRKFHQELIQKDYRDLLAYSDLEREVDSILKNMTKPRSTADLNVLNLVTDPSNNY